MESSGELPFAPPDVMLDVVNRHWSSMENQGATQTRTFINNLAERFGLNLGANDQESSESDSEPEIDDVDDWDSRGPDSTLEGAYWATSLLSLPVMPKDRHASCALEIEAGVIAQAILDGEWQLGVEAPYETLLEIAKKGRSSLAEMLEGNVRLALYWANRYSRGNPDLAQDLFQEAFEGLVRGVEKWDALRGYAFSTYASWHIRQRIQRGLDGPASTTPVHIPVHVLESQRAALRAGEEPNALGNRALQWQNERISWELIKEEVPDLISLLETDPIEEITERICIADTVGQCLAYLPEREADILIRRFGLIDEPETLDSIGEHYGISRERIRQLERKALVGLQLHIASLDAYAGSIVDRLSYRDQNLAEQARIVLATRSTTLTSMAKTLKTSNKDAEVVYDAIVQALRSLSPSLSDLPRIWITPSPDDPVMRGITDFEPTVSIK